MSSRARKRRARGQARKASPAAGPPSPGRAGKVGHEAPGSVLRGPPITITCACGEKRSLRYGQTWTCARCGNVWDTGKIPPEEYAAIRRTTWRFRLLPITFGLIVATLALFFILTGNGTSVFVLLPLSLMVWFTFLRGAHRRRFRSALADRQRWRLDAGRETDPRSP